MEVQDSKWREYTGKVPEPRPGSVRFPVCLLQRHSPLCSSLSLQCITDLHRSQSINTSRDLPDNVLTFARRHPLMAGQVHPVGLRPLMFKRSVNYVRIAVHKEPALDGNLYTVLFLGTGEFREGTLTSSSAFNGLLHQILSRVVSHPPDDGWLHRAVDVQGEMHIIEELQLFDKPQPVEGLVISSALVGAPSGFSDPQQPADVPVLRE